VLPLLRHGRISTICPSDCQGEDADLPKCTCARSALVRRCGLHIIPGTVSPRANGAGVFRPGLEDGRGSEPRTARVRSRADRNGRCPQQPPL
jgi:hypothetical protein